MALLRKHGHLPALGVIVLVGFGLRAWGLTWGLWNASVERRPQPDEWVVYWLARWFHQYHALNPCPNAGKLQCFFDWGTFYPYLAYGTHFISDPFAGPAALGPQAQLAFVQAVLAGRLTSLLLSALTIVAGYWLGSQAFGRSTGMIAAVLIALSTLLIELAHFATPDSTTVLLCTATLIACSAAVRYRSTRCVPVAGFLGGLATGSEYHMALLAIPIMVTWALVDRRRPWLLVAAAGIAILAFLAVNPYIPLEFSGFRAAMLHTLRIRTVDSGLEYGDRFAGYGPIWLYVIRYVLGYGAGIAAAAWLLLGAAWSVREHRRADLVLLAWVIPYALLISVSSAKFLRYGAPLMPVLAVLAARFGVDLWLRSRHNVRPAIALAAAAAIIYSLVYDAAYAGLFASPDPRALATAWLRSHAAPGARIAFQSLPDGLINLPYFVGAAGYHPCFSLYRPDRLNAPTRFLVVDAYTLEEHSRFSDAQVSRYYQALGRSPSYRVVERIHYVPTFLGLHFPLDGSPHDWRYAAHDITIYRHLGGSRSSVPYCFPSVAAATAALYVPSRG